MTHIPYWLGRTSWTVFAALTFIVLGASTGCGAEIDDSEIDDEETSASADELKGEGGKCYSGWDCQRGLRCWKDLPGGVRAGSAKAASIPGKCTRRGSSW